MKKKILGFIFCALILCFGLFFVNDTKVVFASDELTDSLLGGLEGNLPEDEDELLPDEPEETPTQSQINKLFEKGHAISPSTHITDSVLYERLLDVITEYAETLGYRITCDELYSEMFTSYAVEDKMVNITEIVIQDDLIESLEGIEYLRLDNIRKLTISSNKLTGVKADSFQNMENIEYLNLANNQLESVDLSVLRDLKYVNLSSNLLKEVDLSNIITTNVEINLANNNFTDMAKIKLPTRAREIKLNILSNNIPDIANDYFENSKIKLSAGIQGVKNTKKVTKIDTATPLKVYKMNIDNLSLVVYKHLNLIDQEVYKTITDADIDGNVLDVLLPIGDYSYEYFILDEPAYDKYDEDKKIYVRQEFQVNPQTANYLYEFKGETYETLHKVTGVVTVRLSCEEGGKIYYCINGSDWIEGDAVVCDGGGSQNIMVKVEKDGYSSEILNVRVNASLNKYIPDFLMFILIFGLALALFLVVIPLISRKFFRK